MTDAASATPSLPTNSTSGESAGSVVGTLEDFKTPWPDLSLSRDVDDGGFTEPGSSLYASYTYSFSDSGPSSFPNVDTPLQESSSATVPKVEDHPGGGAVGFDYDAVFQDVLRRQEEQEKDSQLQRDSELHTQAPNEKIPFPSLYRDDDVDHREQHRKRVRSMGASSQRGTRKESGRRDSERRDGLRATNDTEGLEEMKASAFAFYPVIRSKLQGGLVRKDVDDEEDPKWLSHLLAQTSCEAETSEAPSTRKGRVVKKAAA